MTTTLVVDVPHRNIDEATVDGEVVGFAAHQSTDDPADLDDRRPLSTATD